MKNLFFCFLIFISASVFGQDKSVIEKQFMHYNSLIVNREFDKSIDLYAHEGVLKIIPKDALVEAMKVLFANPEMEFKTYPPKDIVIEDSFQNFIGQTYVKMNFTQSLDIKYLDLDADSDLILSALQAEFGYEKVKYNEESGFYEIRSGKSAVANSTDLKNWKFTILEKEQIPFLKQFIPETFLKNL